MWTTHGWNLVSRRLLNDWEIGEVVKLGCPGINLDPDRLTWAHQKDGKFSVNKLYKWWGGERASRCRSLGPWGAVWKNVAPTKLKCFTWLGSQKSLFDS